MKHLPNILSLLRMVGAVVLLLCDVVGTTLALPSSVTTRPSPSELGWLSLLRPFWVLYALCGFSDIADGWLARKLISALVMYGCCRFPHTLANKWAGFLLFIAVPMIIWSIAPITIVASVATFAAVQEGHFIRTRNNMRKIVTSDIHLECDGGLLNRPETNLCCDTRRCSYRT